MSDKYRQCCECGATLKSQDPHITLHRFPNLRKVTPETLKRVRGWAKFCYPDKDCFDFNFLKKLHQSHKLLCNRHFEPHCFSAPNRLSKFGVPTLKNVKCHGELYTQRASDPETNHLFPDHAYFKRTEQGASDKETNHLHPDHEYVKRSVELKEPVDLPKDTGNAEEKNQTETQSEHVKNTVPADSENPKSMGVENGDGLTQIDTLSELINTFQILPTADAQDMDHDSEFILLTKTSNLSLENQIIIDMKNGSDMPEIKIVSNPVKTKEMPVVSSLESIPEKYYFKKWITGKKLPVIDEVPKLPSENMPKTGNDMPVVSAAGSIAQQYYIKKSKKNKKIPEIHEVPKSPPENLPKIGSYPKKSEKGGILKFVGVKKIQHLNWREQRLYQICKLVSKRLSRNKINLKSERNKHRDGERSGMPSIAL